MARSAQIVGESVDVFGVRWDVRERRPTAHGWSVDIGWPKGEPRGKGGRGIAVIATQPLADYLIAYGLHPGSLQLPIGRTAIKRLRQAVGLNWFEQRAAWWEAHRADLASLTLEQFADRHGVLPSTVEANRLRLIGHVGQSRRSAASARRG